jgi:hypothetical protein
MIIPGDGSNETAADDIHINNFGVDEFIAYSLGDSGTEEEGGEKVEECGPKGPPAVETERAW